MNKKFQILGMVSTLLCSPAFSAEAELPEHHLALVVGPARSGTSTVTAAIKACGWNLSPAAKAWQKQIQEGKEEAGERRRLNPNGTNEDPVLNRIMQEHEVRVQEREPSERDRKEAEESQQKLEQARAELEEAMIDGASEARRQAERKVKKAQRKADKSTKKAREVRSAPHPNDPRMKKGRENIASFLKTAFAEADHVVLKHPRLSWFGSILEWYANQEDPNATPLNMQTVYIVALRHPVDVALSMKAGFAERRPAATIKSYMERWEVNLLQALASSDTSAPRQFKDGSKEVTLPPANKRVFVKYEEIMDKTDETLVWLASKLGTVLTDEALADFKKNFLLEGQRTNKTSFTDDHPDHPMTDSQRALRDHLESLYQAQFTATE